MFAHEYVPQSQQLLKKHCQPESANLIISMLEPYLLELAQIDLCRQGKSLPTETSAKFLKLTKVRTN